MGVGLGVEAIALQASWVLIRCVISNDLGMIFGYRKMGTDQNTMHSLKCNIQVKVQDDSQVVGGGLAVGSAVVGVAAWEAVAAGERGGAYSYHFLQTMLRSG